MSKINFEYDHVPEIATKVGAILEFEFVKNSKIIRNPSVLFSNNRSWVIRKLCGLYSTDK